MTRRLRRPSGCRLVAPPALLDFIASRLARRRVAGRPPRNLQITAAASLCPIANLLLPIKVQNLPQTHSLVYFFPNTKVRYTQTNFDFCINDSFLFSL